jgi:hypothetical protein
MSIQKRVGRVVAAALATGALFAAAAAVPAAAYPLPLTAEDTNYLNAAHASGFPGDDDVLLIVGRQMCRQLFTGQSASDVIGSISGEYGASPAQTASVLRAARGAYCTSAPG